MDEKVILIYQEDIKLNQILKEQISVLNLNPVCLVKEEKKLVELIEKKTINLLILDLNYISQNLVNNIEKFKLLNKIDHLVGFYDQRKIHPNMKETEITLLQKPFKITCLVKVIDKLLSSKNYQKSDIFLTRNLKFLPYEKIIINLKTQNKQHLTEKENKVLFYLYANKTNKVTKNHLLHSIWGFSKNINTHTLETHIYRLKQKLYKLEPRASFLLSNQNGLYVFQFENIKPS